MKRESKHRRLQYYYYNEPGGLGDNCMSAIIAEIMRENGYQTYFYAKLLGFDKLIEDVLVYDPSLFYDYTFDYDNPSFTIPVNKLNGKHYIDAFFEFNKLPMRFDGRAANIIFNDVDVPIVDVALNTKCSNWAIKRRWPHFDKLKEYFRANGISFFDLDTIKYYSWKNSESSAKALNIAAKSKIYVGLDTGMSHFVAKYVKKGLIIQSGFSLFSNWNNYNNFYFTGLNVPCSPCWISEHIPGDCPGKDNKCMEDLSASMVFQNILTLLN